MADANFRDSRIYLAHLLRVLADRGASRPGDIYDEVAKRAGVTPEQREARTDASGGPVYWNRIQFARQGLVDAELLVASSDPGWRRGVWELSEEGRRIARATTDDRGLEMLVRERAATGAKTRLAARKASRALAGLVDEAPATAGEQFSSTPALHNVQAESLEAQEPVDIGELVDAANEAALNAMLDHVRAMNETAFEHLVGDVLKAALRAESVRVTQKSRDGGVDGVLAFDSLGMRTAVFEAKRYADGNVVGRPLVDAFATAARRQRANHSLFVTTSSFSAEAQATARDERVRLIDGYAFVELMARHGIGLRAKQTFVVYEVDPAWTLAADTPE